MAAVDEVDELIEQFHLASDEFLKGNPEPVNKLWSHREDVTLANPFGPPVRGWDEVAKAGGLDRSPFGSRRFQATPEFALGRKGPAKRTPRAAGPGFEPGSSHPKPVAV